MSFECMELIDLLCVWQPPVSHFTNLTTRERSVWAIQIFSEWINIISMLFWYITLLVAPCEWIYAPFFFLLFPIFRKERKEVSFSIVSFNKQKFKKPRHLFYGTKPIVIFEVKLIISQDVMSGIYSPSITRCRVFSGGGRRVFDFIAVIICIMLCHTRRAENHKMLQWKIQNSTQCYWGKCELVGLN